MWWTPGGSEQPRAAATLPAGVPPPGPGPGSGPGHAGRRGCYSRESKYKSDSCPGLMGVPGTRRKDDTDKKVISFIACQEQGNDLLVTAEPLFLSLGGRQHAHKLFKGRIRKENIDPRQEQPKNTNDGVSGTGSHWTPARPHSRPAGTHTHVTDFSVLPNHRRRRRHTGTWLDETEGRCSPSYLRSRHLRPPTWAWLWATAALVVWWCTVAATAGGCRFPANQSEFFRCS